ncbi:class I SAM-dependent methyltransferase [archaeon]|nr:MAG: class I SAM-dependent methyltransferase [archaeon]
MTLLPVEDQYLGYENFFDFIYSFDVFPHVDTHGIFSYLKEIFKALKPEGLAFFSTSNLLADGEQ